MEIEIIDVVLENLKQTTGIQAFFEQRGPLDGRLAMSIHGQKYTYAVELKGEIRNHHLQEIENYFRNHENYLLVANRIFPKIKEELRQKEIPYLEANGNIFLKKERLFLFVDTQKTIDIGKTRGTEHSQKQV